MDVRNSTLAVVTTYASAPYVDLAVTNLKSFGIKCIVIDDGSGSKELEDVCGKHDVQLLGLTRPRLGHSNGDFLSTCTGIKAADDLGYSLCLKVSRRWTPLIDPIPSLQRLHDITGGYTYSNATRPEYKEGFGFRTDTFVVDVNAYKDKLPDMMERLNSDTVGLVEARFHKYARMTQPRTNEYKKYMWEHRTYVDRNGYVAWDWLGNHSCARICSRLQPEANKIIDYVDEARRLGLPYTGASFTVK